MKSFQFKLQTSTSLLGHVTFLTVNPGNWTAAKISILSPPLGIAHVTHRLCTKFITTPIFFFFSGSSFFFYTLFNFQVVSMISEKDLRLLLKVKLCLSGLHCTKLKVNLGFGHIY